MGAPLKGFRSRSVGIQPYYRHWFQCSQVCVRARICVTLSPLSVFFLASRVLCVFGFFWPFCVFFGPLAARVSFWPLSAFLGLFFVFFGTLQVSFWPVNEKGDAPKVSVTNPKSFEKILKY